MNQLKLTTREDVYMIMTYSCRSDHTSALVTRPTFMLQEEKSIIVKFMRVAFDKNNLYETSRLTVVSGPIKTRKI